MAQGLFYFFMIIVDNPLLRLLKFILLAFFFLIDVQRFPVEVFAGKPVEESNFIEVLARVTHSTAINPELISSFANKAKDFLPLAKTSIVTLIDFSLPSTARRLWTINLETGEVLYNTWVAHGKNSGNNEAQSFSNKPQSYQSSLGFYLTDQTYTGKHGHSLRLKGLEKNINDKAWERAIVIHGADYVTESFIKTHGRLGRSHGCPAIPPEITDEFINTVKDGSLLFIYHPGYKKG